MKVCYWGTYQRGYIRNRVILSGLRQAGVEIRECHVPVWRDEAEDKVAAVAGLGGRLRFLLRLLCAYPRLVWRFLRQPRPDVMFIGYLGHLDMLVAWPLARLRGIPIVFDAFLSLFDMVVNDRQLFRSGSVVAKLCYALDVLSCRLADRVLLDTEEHCRFFARAFGVPREKLHRILVGADDETLRAHERPRGRGELRVLYFGKYIPLHGMNFILQAAGLLKGHAGIQFRLVGQGQLYEEMRSMAEQLQLKAIAFIDDWLSPEELREEIIEADVCLGVFGNTDKAKRVIPNKVYESLAMGKPVITGDTPAAQELLRHGETALLCEVASPQALADAILLLGKDPELRARIGRNGLALFRARCRPRLIGQEVVEIMRSLLGDVSGPDLLSGKECRGRSRAAS